MKKFIPLIFIGIVACGTKAPEGLTVGAGITQDKMTQISDILADPSQYVDQMVVISGKIDAVCPMQGCWIDVLDEESNKKIRVKVEDGKIVFPAESEGRMVKVEGKVEEKTMTKEEYISYKKHEAEELGIEFDPASVTGPETTYRIWGLGATIAP